MFEFCISAFSGSQKFSYMSPVHADEMNRALLTDLNNVFEYSLQEIRKLSFRHLARSHFKRVVLCSTQTADMAINGDVIRRINKNHICFICSEQTVKTFYPGRIPAIKAMRADLPKIAKTRDGFLRKFNLQGLRLL